jgi:hypothetical protein
MRTEKELWQLVLSRQDLFEEGLCLWILNLRFVNEINLFEYRTLRQSLSKNLPFYSPDLFCWFRDDIQPRIDWINERIKQLDDERT